MTNISPVRARYSPIWVIVDVHDLSSNRLPDGSQHPFGSGRSLHPLSTPLQHGIRFFHHPLTATTSQPLTVR
ncbi:hypothetical protein DSN16_01170 [Salmonella enterica subsp. enterica serovar Abony]|uniref:Uncharacterized protein n=1 Tax=Salmonella abony TaxID=29482 RepID=A0A5V0F6U2_SALAB|nr:hypothetical protein [Salmonella enterica subsp. enterica serovar Abony]EBS6065895.1 hypothetical protein [Salmonella enterica subsp. enterica serovar Abony]EBX4618039.1 hypothetical protein [Salmonella enterica subsp. enterica serovar Abony]EBX5512822.1 hypothetical protein [Salmonella enterica subsp. enterica serovar Abony]ECE0418639.1 hypothetical protein [Salmonella enterica subsp. enterica serovar Abony]